MFCRVHLSPSTLSALCPQPIAEPAGGKPDRGMKLQHEGPQGVVQVSVGHKRSAGAPRGQEDLGEKDEAEKWSFQVGEQ